MWKPRADEYWTFNESAEVTLYDIVYKHCDVLSLFLRYNFNISHTR